VDSSERSALQSFAAEYKAGVVVLTRPKPIGKSARRVNVYVDGLLTVMSEDTLQRLIDTGFYQEVPA
jgi:hypothetical protein